MLLYRLWQMQYRKLIVMIQLMMQQRLHGTLLFFSYNSL
jgi:hypothetical protein